jgi:hypothetical protein
MGSTITIEQFNVDFKLLIECGRAETVPMKFAAAHRILHIEVQPF